jgi:protein TonB
MEVLMLSVSAKATQLMTKPTSLIKKEPVIPSPIIKKPPSTLIKKPSMIIPSETMPSALVAAELVPKEITAPPSVSDPQKATVAISNVESIVKSTALNSHEQDADKNVVISGIMPLVKVNPIYPNRAVSHGIEGWVRIEFTIQADGSVANAVIVQSMPEAVFDDAALAAINQWQFKPKVVNGVAVPQRAGQQLQFKLDR